MIVKIFRIWSRSDLYEQTAYAAEVGPKILKYYEEYFDTPFPLPKQDMIAIPGLIKEMSICNKLWLSNSYNLATHSPRPLIFQTINSVRSNSLSLKYQRFTPSGCEVIAVRKFEFVAKTQFLCLFIFERGRYLQLHRIHGLILGPIARWPTTRPTKTNKYHICFV